MKFKYRYIVMNRKIMNMGYQFMTKKNPVHEQQKQVRIKNLIDTFYTLNAMTSWL